MKKIVSVITLVALLAAMLVCFASCAEKTKTVFAPSGESKGTLRLGFDVEYPPYGYLDSETNQYAGFDIDFAKAVCEKIGYTLELIPIDWNDKDTKLKSDEINCIWSGFTIQGREDDYAWTVPYSDSSIVILTAADSGINSIADLAGKIVSVQLDSSGETALKEMADLVKTFKDGKYQTCANYTSGFMDLESGAVEALAIDIGVAKDIISGKTGFVILDEPLSVEQYGVGFAKNNTELRDLISNTMKQLKDKAAEIAAKYDISDSIKIGE